MALIFGRCLALFGAVGTGYTAPAHERQAFFRWLAHASRGDVIPP